MGSPGLTGSVVLPWPLSTQAAWMWSLMVPHHAQVCSWITRISERGGAAQPPPCFLILHPV